ncbi:ankyrin repeat protein [Acanthamoeba polyphaga moumouvirus]|uniref:Ankyrin repeat protein n=2 Tax=Moumouvirus TaxID=3080801 RepID=L7RB17_9VIRU|nr:ankyrin repeat protein [Acanthamoeba polyphaga moumouvirus]AEX63285.1 putative ankyrin repeat protein [Moumouvirus Monve]AGC01589.1 ankyrin repeat protein [Acanthamoeba polyphaga moumouvirus]
MKSLIEINNSYNYEKIYPCTEEIYCSGFTKLMYLIINEKNMFKGYQVIKKYLIKNKNKIYYQNELGYTALMLAVINYPTKTSFKTIKLLLEFGPMIVCNNDGYDAICLAIKTFNNHNSLKLIKLLLECDLDFIDYCFDEDCVISFNIILSINISILSLILDNILDINKRISHNETYIAKAISMHNYLLVRELIKRDCDLSLDYNYGNNLLHYCIHYDFYDVYTIKCIINAGCNINKINENDLSPLMMICKNTKTMPNLEIDIIKVISIVILLLENGANINLKNKSNRTAISLVCKYNNKYSRKIIKLLIQNGVDLNYKTLMTPLIVASKYSRGDNKIVKLLLESGADINYNNTVDCHALMYACRYAGTTSHISTVKLLLESGSDVNLKNIGGKTALTYTSRYSKLSSHNDVVTLLLDYGADINILSNKKDNALLLSCRKYKSYSDISTILLLLSYGSDYLIKDKNGETLFSYISGDELFTCFKIIKTIENSKSCLKKTLKQFMQVIENKFYDPNGFRIKLLNLKWNLESNNLDKVITWENLELFNYFDVYDFENVKIKILDNTKYMF